ncbi:MAG: hypothetical protein CMP65_04380 [Flavobacteriales bacterium]|nr:hypothetical protein [Flavobacteriales bacterium]
MEGGIQNKVQDAGLVIFEVSNLQAVGVRKELDFAIFLKNNPIIIEADFKKELNSYDWGQYKDCFVAITCSKDAIIPPWAYLFIQVKLLNIAKRVFFCSLISMELLLFQTSLKKINLKDYENKTVFLKVCSGKNYPTGVLSLCVEFLSPHVKSLFYGEPCSSVPLFKNLKNRK